ncbi:hypothetical protein CYMTET_50634 [Cymbomonas tetramitiformis]|uniref:Uncharacterized protein n=1 Tax=Cymbomonas tetramitiformis TaxID=36881 RepID=A0AAE0BPP4_9CHLO|nr:hypothetical protein CYMTET_50634 [Cymbomonas tetramitiformis]|eukprot:gene11299-13351_t
MQSVRYQSRYPLSLEQLNPHKFTSKRILQLRTPVTGLFGSGILATKHTKTSLHLRKRCTSWDAGANQLKLPGASISVRCSSTGQEASEANGDELVLAEPESLASGVLKGFAAALQGGTASINTAGGAYKNLTAAVFATSLLMDAGGIYSLNLLTESLLGSDPDILWLAFIAVLKVPVFGTVIFISPLLAVFAVQLALPLLGESLFFGALKEIRPSRAEVLERSGGLGPRGISVAVSRILMFLKWQFGLLVISLPIGFVPIFGPILTAGAQLTLSSYIFGWEMLDVWCDKNAFDLEGQKRIMKGQKWALIGFAAPYTLLLAIPIFGPFTVGIAQSAAARLVTSVMEKSEGEVEQ